MRWFRANRVFGGRLALFALAVQLVLSFGHIHRSDIFGYGPPAAASAGTASDYAQSKPAGSPSGHAGDYCDICATVSLLSSSFVAAAPQLPLPIAFRRVEHHASAASDFVVPQRSPFQSRGPPLA
jgi:hypothetical protein